MLSRSQVSQRRLRSSCVQIICCFRYPEQSDGCTGVFVDARCLMNKGDMTEQMEDGAMSCEVNLAHQENKIRVPTGSLYV